jgi:hypothetical protein
VTRSRLDLVPGTHSRKPVVNHLWGRIKAR